MQPEMQSSELNVSVLLSVGAHPKTARSRRADQDAKALELALSLPKARVAAIHAGDAGDEALRQYLGMGLPALQVLPQPKEADVVPVLVDYLRQHPATLVLTGGKAEQGESSGMLPYLLAQELGWPVVPRVAAVESVGNGKAAVLQALPRGQRRALTVSLPCVLCIDEAAPAPRQSAFALGQRGKIEVLSAAVTTDSERADWTVQPARKRPKRLKVVKAKTAADRFKAATAKASGDGGQVIVPKTVEEGAEAILKMLKEEGVLR
ncbi:electron transfer flavoprotein subunit beta [Pokkaliibacter plantistimulans]|uniref:Electron transfer flavoprotein subunit beta n=1 Tax=Pokkaliibacter plantistimulans TaxID=1635171 RepID=A0ABX5LTH8_9GAMM|nr:electron transfer flavoprotein subunit beta [Pokkaliibacter plantistimulans]PXF29981.1 electron transfer flavoprotein subunit beta [Pokkaliibacter plantistimulans]